MKVKITSIGIFYIICMENNYRTTKTTVSEIQFHVVFCPRYRRKIFNVEGVKERFETLARAECKRQEIEVLEIAYGADYVYMKISVLPKLSVNDALLSIKKVTGRALQDEFPIFASMPALWTKTYFVTTEEKVSAETIRNYVESQANGPTDAKKKKNKENVGIKE